MMCFLLGKLLFKFASAGFISSIFSARKAWLIVHHIRFLLADDEVARFVFGQAGVHQRPDLREFVLGVELLADPSGRRGCGIDHHSGIQRLFRFEPASFKYKCYENKKGH
jgi:hypothetical protein